MTKSIMIPIRSKPHHTPPVTAKPTTKALSMLATFVTLTPVSQADPLATPVTQLPRLTVYEPGYQPYSKPRLASGKFTESIIDTPQQISVFSSALWQEQGAKSLTETLRNSPAVSTFFAGENGSTSTGDAIYMRGFDSSSSIYLDGARDLGSVTRDLFNIEQVEVTKGPSGADYGRTSPTGSINLVSKQPQLQDRSRVDLSYGSAQQRRMTTDFNRTASADSGYRLTTMWQDSGVPGRDVIRQKRWGIAPSAAFGVGSDTKLTVSFQHVAQSNIPDGNVPTIGLPGYRLPQTEPGFASLHPHPVSPANFYGTSSDHETIRADIATVQVRHDFSPTLHLQNLSRWSRNDQDYLLTSYLANVASLIIPNRDQPATWTLARNIPTLLDQRRQILTNQTNLNQEFATGQVTHHLATGVELTREQLQAKGHSLIGSWPAANVYRPNYHLPQHLLQLQENHAYENSRTQTVAWYLFDSIKFGERWQLNPGIRWDHYQTQDSAMLCNSARGQISCPGAPMPLQLVRQQIEGNLVSWKLGLVYQPTPTIRLYTNYATGQQPPGGASLQLSTIANSANNPHYRPQVASNRELGIKWSPAQERLLVTGSLFETRIDHEVIKDPIDDSYQQTGQKQVRGLELSAIGDITRQWQLSAGLSTMRATVRKGPRVTANGTDILAYTPSIAFTSWTMYHFMNGFSIGGGARYTGPITRGNDNAAGTPTKIDAYWVIDGQLGYQINDHLEVNLNAYNLLNQRYQLAINKSGYRYTPGYPYSYLINLIMRF